MECDPCALPQLARNFHIAAVKQRDALNDRQPQTSSPRTLGTRRIDTKEAIKNPRQSFRGNADASVGDFDANRRRIGGRSPTSTAPPGGVCAKAFETRLPTALCKSVRSSSAMTGSAATAVVSETPPSAAEAS